MSNDFRRSDPGRAFRPRASGGAAGASLFLTFLPSQILLNNLLYDTSQLAIPTDDTDPEQVARPDRWDVGFIRRFMLFFGPVSSVFDFLMFGVMLWGFHAGLFFVTLVLMVVAYLLLIELGKYWFYRSYRASAAPAVPRPGRRRQRRVYRRAARFTTSHRLHR